MNRHDGARLSWNDGLLHARRVEQQGSRVDVDECDAKAAIERRRGAGDERKVRYDDLAPVVEAVVIQKRGERDAQRIGAVRHQQAIAAAAIGRPLLREFLRQRLRQTLDAAQEHPAELRARATVPAQEIAIAIGRPRTITGIAHRSAAVLGQRAGETRRRPRQLAQGRSHQRTQPGLRLRKQFGGDRIHCGHRGKCVLLLLHHLNEETIFARM